METILDILLGPTRKEKKVVRSDDGYITNGAVVTTGWDKSETKPLFPLINELLFAETKEKVTGKTQTDRKSILVD